MPRFIVYIKCRIICCIPPKKKKEKEVTSSKHTVEKEQGALGRQSGDAS